jgi:isoleucyl-tRNA synthetase
VRKVLLTYWNTVAFQALYARTNGWTPGDAPAPADRHVLDRWLLSVTHELVRDVTNDLENFDTLAAGTRLQSFTDDLSNWYVRRSRRRFWDGEGSALQTLHEVLDVVTRLMAPLVPFITERVWQDLVVATDPAAPESVHLASWPVADEPLIDPELSREMGIARRVVELGRAARSEAKVKTRQPLRRALLANSTLSQLNAEIVNEITSELNVGALESFGSAGDLVDYSAKGNFRALGKRFGKQTPLVAQAIADADAHALAVSLRTDGRATVAFEGGTEVTADEVIVSERPREGWSVVNEQGETVALDLELTPELVRAGLLRDVVRTVQEARKNAGLEVSDRITLTWAGSGQAAEVLRTDSASVADEVLATSVVEAESPGDGWVTDVDLALSFSVTKV